MPGKQDRVKNTSLALREVVDRRIAKSVNSGESSFVANDILPFRNDDG